MINVEAEGMEAIAKTLESMAQQIDALGKQEMFKELLAWQVEDMHRKYPNTTQDDEKTVSTEVWPRSRLSILRSMMRGNPRRVYAPPRAYSTRPILRSELFDILCVRMAALMDRVLTWQTKA